MVDESAWDRGESRELVLPGTDGTGSRAASSARRSVSGHMMASLMKTIEGAVIPRLLVALQSPPAAGGGERAATSASDVAEFAALVATRDVTVATAYINALLNRGIALEQIYLDLLAPAARLLGEWWKADLRDFTEVTSGLCRMHQLLHEFSPVFLREVTTAAPDKCILLMPMPGEQHSFGLIMVAEFFRRAGWDVWDLHPSTTEDVMAAIGQQWFAAIGISLSCESKVGRLASLIGAVRSKSLNRSVGVMVGGQPFIDRPGLVEESGADCTAADGGIAPVRAAKLLDELRDASGPNGGSDLPRSRR